MSETGLQDGHQQEPSTATTDTEAQERRDSVTQDAGSDDDLSDDESDAMSVDALEDQFALLEEEVANLVADVHDLALYTKLNITGFMKILKVRSSFASSAGLKLISCRATFPLRAMLET